MKRKGVVVITGASSGVGRATARLFADNGYDVGLIARGADGLEHVRSELAARGARARAQAADISDAAQVDAAAEEIERDLGPIDVWINNAAVSIVAPVSELSVEEIRRVTDVDYHGAVHGTLAALKRMRPRDRGVIVQVSSALAERAVPLQAPYCAAKHALKGFTESLRVELMHERSGVKVTIVHLPAINTPYYRLARSKVRGRPRPLGPVFQPEVAARALFEAAHRPRRELRFGAAASMFVLGERLAPGLLDRLLSREGYRGQIEPEPRGTEKDNLWRTGNGLLRAHGDFDREAAASSPHLWYALHRPALWALGAALLAAGAYGLLRSRRHLP